MDIAAAFLSAIINAFEANKRLADRAVEQVPDDKLHAALDEKTNSIAVMMKHVAGNLASRWTDFLTTDGDKPWRDRDAEFILTEADTRAHLLEAWEVGWSALFRTLAGLGEEDLRKQVTIRGEGHSVLQAIHRSLTHTAYHTGQIVYLSRLVHSDAWQWITIPPR